MKASTCIFASALLVVAGSYAVPALADDSYAINDDVPLYDSDLAEITAQILATNPELASSAGIKFAEAQRSARSTDIAYVIYHPHSDTGGVKQALQASCTRTAGQRHWDCEDVAIRRYIRVESQDFEVRVVGDIESADALAVVEATRDHLPLVAGGISADSCTAIMLWPKQDGYKLQWACDGREKALFLHATAIAGADKALASSWRVSEYVFPQ